MDDPRYADRAQASGLSEAGYEDRIERREESLHTVPEVRDDRIRARIADDFGERWAQIRAQVVRVPEGRSDARAPPAACNDARRAEVRRVSFQYVRPFQPYVRSNLVEASEQVVGAIIRKGRPADAYEPCLASREGNLGLRCNIFIPWSGCDHDVGVTELA
jgi:hypothetical protein